MSTRVDQAQQVNIAKPTLQVKECSVELPVSIVGTNELLGALDKAEMRNKRDIYYSQLQAVCDRFNIDLNKLKKMNLLETVLGCDSETLVKKDISEIKSVVAEVEIICKQDLMTQARTLWNGKAGKKFIKNLAQKIIDRRTRIDTGVNKWEQFIFGLTTEVTLQEELVKQGHLKEGEALNDKALQDYFYSSFLKDIEGKTDEQKERRYKKALEAFGNLQLRYNSTEERVALTSVIQLLSAEHRYTAIKVSNERAISNQEESDRVALQNFSNNVENFGTRDALGKQMSKEDAMATVELNINAMSSEARCEAVEMAERRRKELQDKTPEELSEAEQFYNEIALEWEASATVVALAKNSEYDLVNTAIENAKDAGVNNELINKLVKEYFGGENTPEYQQFKAALEVAQKKAENQALIAGKVDSSAAKAPAAKVSTETAGSTGSREASRVISAVQENATNASNPISTLVVNLFVNNQQAMALAKKDIAANAETILESREENIPEVVSPTLDMYLNNGGTLKLYLNSNPNKTHSALKDAFNMFNRLNDEDKDLAIAYYAQLDDDRQASMLQEVGNTALSILLEYASNKTLANLDKKDLNNSIAQHLFEQRQEQIQETSLA